MGKPESSPAPITAEDLRAYIESKDDFAFEREVYHIANGLGLSAEHAGLYEDPVTNKPRQFDIRASRALKDQKICLAIECKGLTETYPLIVSCVPRAQAESFHEILYTDEVPGPRGSHTRVSRRRSEFYNQGEPVGKAMRQVRRDNQKELVGGDEVFDKWMQALASAADLIADAAAQLSGRRAGVPQRIAVLPVLVVSDRTLWIADYASNGRLQRDPFQLDEITFFLGRKYELPQEQVSFTISHLHIHTRGRVGEFLGGVADDGGIWQELFAERVSG